MQLSLAAPTGQPATNAAAAPLAPSGCLWDGGPTCAHLPTVLVSLLPANLTAPIVWFLLQQNMPLNRPIAPVHPALRAGSWIKGAAKAAGIPVYSLKAASLSNLVRCGTMLKMSIMAVHGGQRSVCPCSQLVPSHIPCRVLSANTMSRPSCRAVRMLLGIDPSPLLNPRCL